MFLELEDESNKKHLVNLDTVRIITDTVDRRVVQFLDGTMYAYVTPLVSIKSRLSSLKLQ